MGKTTRRQITAKARFEIFKRDGFKCQYCGHAPPDVALVLDHVIPVSKGGQTTAGNLITSCNDCNAGKHAQPLYVLTKIVVRNHRQTKEKQDPAKRREKNRLERLRKRRANGQIPRAEYLANAASRKLWIPEGISRRTWYRRQRAATAAMPP